MVFLISAQAVGQGNLRVNGFATIWEVSGPCMCECVLEVIDEWEDREDKEYL